MKLWVNMMALAMVAVLAGRAAGADPTPTPPPKADKPEKKAVDLRGEIVKIDGKDLTIQTSAKRGDAKQVTIATDDKTVITIEDKPATLAEVKVGQKVRITPETGTATKVEIRGKAKK